MVRQYGAKNEINIVGNGCSMAPWPGAHLYPRTLDHLVTAVTCGTANGQNFLLYFVGSLANAIEIPANDREMPINDRKMPADVTEILTKCFGTHEPDFGIPRMHFRSCFRQPIWQLVQ